MRGELRNVVYNVFNCSIARGLFFDGNDAYVVEVYDSGKTDEIGVKLYGSESEFVDLVYNMPEINGVGMNESLSMTDEEADLPESGEEIEALARYVLQEGPDQGLEYTGPLELEDIRR